MQLLISILFLLVFGINQPDNKQKGLNDIRKLYIMAGSDLSFRKDFLDYFSTHPPELPEEFAYKAAAILMSAEITPGKFDQYQIFKRGKNLLDSTINIHKKNLEIRYLRFEIQEHVPGFLSYDNRMEDKSVILDNISDIDSINNIQLKLIIRNTMLNSEKLSSQEKEQITQYISL